MRYEEVAPEASFSSCVERFGNFGLVLHESPRLTDISVPDLDDRSVR